MIVSTNSGNYHANNNSSYYRHHNSSSRVVRKRISNSIGIVYSQSASTYRTPFIEKSFLAYRRHHFLGNVNRDYQRNQFRHHNRINKRRIYPKNHNNSYRRGYRDRYRDAMRSRHNVRNNYRNRVRGGFNFGD